MEAIYVGGDINMYLNFADPTADLFKNLNSRWVDRSCIDYLFISDIARLTDYDVIEPDVNLVDHFPIIATCMSGLTRFCEFTSHHITLLDFALRLDSTISWLVSVISIILVKPPFKFFVAVGC